MDQKAYSDLISSLQLSGVVLSELTAHSKSRDFGQITLQVHSKFSITCLERNSEGFVAEARLSLSFLKENEEVGNVTCAYCLHYDSNVRLTDELFDEFSKFNVPVNAWPFLRELVMNTTQRFGWPGFILPPYKVPFNSVTSEAQVEKIPVRVSTPKSKKKTRK
jgi:hypothetical protein